MKPSRWIHSGAVLCGLPALVTGLTCSSQGQAIISNGTIKLGVDSLGQLNIPGGIASVGGTSVVGLRYLSGGMEFESTSPGCLCEGWGVADLLTATSGYANNSAGIGGLTPVSFSSTATTATSVVKVGLTYEVTHEYKPSSETPNLYEVNVSIKNISSDPTHVVYRRVMDWDIDPTDFSEYVTIAGAPTTSALIGASDQGFASADPLTGPASLLKPYGKFDFTDSGPADHGALFDFDFGMLAAGDIYSFRTFYGAAGTETDALLALGEVSAELYSFGQSSTAGGPTLGTPATFIFAFEGVGGTILVPDPTPPNPGGGGGGSTTPVPEASTMVSATLLAGLAGFRIFRSRRLSA
jgi:hypothetical protein